MPKEPREILPTATIPVDCQIQIWATDTQEYDCANHEYELQWYTEETPHPLGGTEPSSPAIPLILKFQKGTTNVGLNGVTHEALIAVLIDRLRCFQSGPFKCRENAIALTHLEEALMWLNQRTRERRVRGVEGTSSV